MDDDVDFFTRKPLASKPKSRFKPKAAAKPVNGAASSHVPDAASSSSSASATSATTSAAARTLNGKTSEAHITHHIEVEDDEDDVDIDEDDDDDDDIVLSSSDMDVSSDDSNASAKRRVKRRKKKRHKTLPVWASQGVYRRPSQEPCFSSSNPALHDAREGASALPSSSRSNGSTGHDASSVRPEPNDNQGEHLHSNGRARRLSLTPPPPPSPEKLSMARDLATRTIASKFGSTSIRPAPSKSTTEAATSSFSTLDAATSGFGRPTRSTRSSTTPAVGQDGAGASASALAHVQGQARATDVDGDEDEDEAGSQIQWDLDLARLMRGQNAKRIREQAKREQEEREAKRRQRELERLRTQPSSLPGASQQRQGQFSRTHSAPQTTAIDNDANTDNESDHSIQLVPRPVKSTLPPLAATESVIVIADSDSDEEEADTAPRLGSSIEADSATLGLTVQSKLGALPVTVTPSTRLETIMAHFHAQRVAQLANVPVDKMRIMFDGFAYTPAQAVRDMDVEDGDQLELVWPS